MTDLSKLTGTVRTLRPQSSDPYGIPWSNIARWEPAFTIAGKEFSVDLLLLAAMAVVESDATHYRDDGSVLTAPNDGHGGGRAIGIMQVKPRVWQWLLPDADPNTPEGNIRLGTAIMARAIRQEGSWQSAIRNVYFPATDPNGTTQDAYVAAVGSLMAEIRNQTKPKPANPPSTDPNSPTSTPQPATTDPIAYIVGGSYPPITYGWLADAGLNYYVYGVNHGTQRASQHTGVDVGVPDHTPLYAPAPGKVLCVGNAGQNIWGQGCGAYEDTGINPPRSPLEGVGNITILLDSGHKLTLGHCDDCLFRPGDRVKQGDLIGHSGGQNGYHVHIEVAVNRGGTYWLVEPIAALREAMGMHAPAPQQPSYDAPRIDVPQPASFEGQGWTVEVMQDGVPVKQYASRDAPDVAPPLQSGETFTAVYIAYGRDGEPWWIGERRGRVPVAGTDCEALKGVIK